MKTHKYYAFYAGIHESFKYSIAEPTFREVMFRVWEIVKPYDAPEITPKQLKFRYLRVAKGCPEGSKYYTIEGVMQGSKKRPLLLVPCGG